MKAAFLSKKQWQTWADLLTKQAHALYFTWHDPRSPKLVKVLAFVTLAYLFSPIDLIPDVIPILGLVDDLLLIPALCWLVIKLVPDAIWQENLSRAQSQTIKLEFAWMRMVIIAIWLLLAGLIGMSIWSFFS